MNGKTRLSVKCFHDHSSPGLLKTDWQLLYSTDKTGRIRSHKSTLEIEPGMTYGFTVYRCNLLYQGEVLSFLTYVQILFRKLLREFA